MGSSIGTAPTPSDTDEFSDIEAALKVLPKIYDKYNMRPDRIQPLLAVLDFTDAEYLTKDAITANNAVDRSAVSTHLSSSPSYDKAIQAVMKWNISNQEDQGVEYTIDFYPYDFYDQSSFRFDGQYIRAQYLFPFGLGLILQQGGTKVGPVDVAFAREKLGRYFSFRDSDKWRLVSIFAGNAVEDGPEWPGYPTMDEARNAYTDKKVQQEELQKMEKNPPSYTLHPTNDLDQPQPSLSGPSSGPL